MGYFGAGSFENDSASDWLSGLNERNAVSRIRRALAEARDFKLENVEPYSAAEISEMVGKMMAYYRKSPLKAWRDSGRPLEDHLLETERELSERYSSGRYIDEEYGPAEEAIAAAELVAMWGGSGRASNSPYAEPAAKLVSKLAKKPVPPDLVRFSLEAMAKVGTNLRYARMRKYYLESFRDLSGGSDAMAGIRDLVRRLKPLV